MLLPIFKKTNARYERLLKEIPMCISRKKCRRTIDVTEIKLILAGYVHDVSVLNVPNTNTNQPTPLSPQYMERERERQTDRQTDRQFIAGLSTNSSFFVCLLFSLFFSFYSFFLSLSRRRPGNKQSYHGKVYHFENNY